MSSWLGLLMGMKRRFKECFLWSQQHFHRGWFSHFSPSSYSLCKATCLRAAQCGRTSPCEKDFMLSAGSLGTKYLQASLASWLMPCSWLSPSLCFWPVAQPPRLGHSVCLYPPSGCQGTLQKFISVLAQEHARLFRVSSTLSRASSKTTTSVQTEFSLTCGHRACPHL